MQLMCLPLVREMQIPPEGFYRKEWIDRSGQLWRFSCWKAGEFMGRTMLEGGQSKRCKVGREYIFSSYHDPVLRFIQDLDEIKLAISKIVSGKKQMEVHLL